MDNILIDEINYKDYIENKEYSKEYGIRIKLLFVPRGIRYYERHNYHSKMTIFDEDIKEYLKREMLTSYEYDNPITMSDNVYFKDDNGELYYNGARYKSIENLMLDNIECIPLFAFSNYVFKNVTLKNIKIISSCAFYKSYVETMNIDSSVDIIEFNSLPCNLKIIDGYFDIKNNKKLILAKVPDVKCPVISSETKIIYQFAGRELNNIEELIIPEGVTSIGCNAFRNCKNIKIISLPKSLKFIDESAFEDTVAKEVYYNGTYDDWKKIDIRDEDYSLMSYIDRPTYIDTSPVKYNNDFYLLDQNGEKDFNGKKYKKREK